MSRTCWSVIALVTGVHLGGPVSAVETPSGPLRELTERVAEVVQDASTYLVRVIRPTEVPSGDPTQMRRVIGSGISLGNGYVLTSASVVGPAREVLVSAALGDTMPASVVGVDWRTNVAVLKNDGLNLPTAPLADRELLFPGDLIVSVGWGPPGLPRAAFGTVSLAEGINLAFTDVNMIEVTCPIYPGFVGGALVGSDGKVVGLVSGKIFVESNADPEPHGVNAVAGHFQNGILSSVEPVVATLAVPMARAIDIAEDLMSVGYVERGYLGVEVEMTEVVQGRGRKFPGVLIHNLVEGGPATEAGLFPGDVILEYAGARVQSPEDLSFLVGATVPGSSIPVGYLRRGHKGRTHVVIDQAPELTWTPEMDGFLKAPVSESSIAPVAR